jgi:hypothetical protein
VKDLFILFPHIQNPGAAQNAGIAGLPAALRIKSRGV